MPAGQDDSGLASAAPSAAPVAGVGLSGVRFGVDDSDEVSAAGAAAGVVGAALREVRVVLRERAAAGAVRTSGLGANCRVVKPVACRRHVRQIMVCWS